MRVRELGRPHKLLEMISESQEDCRLGPLSEAHGHFDIVALVASKGVCDARRRPKLALRLYTRLTMDGLASLDDYGIVDAAQPIGCTTESS